jgi:hypothetical protein
MIGPADITTRETRTRAREIKFVADISLFPRLVDWARGRLAADTHGGGPYGDEYLTSTLYLETRNFDVYQRRGSYGRSKYRIRRYNGSDLAFLERKFRTERLLAKRRTVVAVDAIRQLADPADDACGPSGWFHRRIHLRRLHPLVQLSYERVARIGQSSVGPVRLTIDRHLRALPLPDFAFLPGTVGFPFLEHSCIVEVKYQTELPALFRELAETFCLDVQKVSKFRAAVRALDYPLPIEPDEQVPHTLPVSLAVDSDPEGAYAD